VIARAFLVAAVAAATLVPSASPVGNETTSYTGTIRFRGEEPSNVTVLLSGSRATVSLAPGHVASTQVGVRRTKETLRFAVPGLPKPVVFALAAKGTKLTGSATQGAASATVTLSRGRASPDASLGYFASPDV